jgi:Glu-tRNA(Gln) amidotransferase subunit E-like FAD-binding protein
MGVRSKILALPEATRSELDQRLISGGFQGYVELEAWLQAQGFEVGKSSIHRYGSAMEQRLAELQRSTQEARALVAAAPDDTDAMARATMQMLQQRLFGLLRDMDEIDPDSVDIAKIAKAMAPLVRASIAQQQHMREVADRAKAAADSVDKLARSGGLSQESADEIRRAILGIAQ